MRALLLCAGLGERLRPLTDKLAKASVPVLNEPLASYPLRRLAEAGVREVAVNLHHLPGTVRAALGDGSRFGMAIRYVEEPAILGTGGAVRNLKDWLGAPCAVANGDTVADLDIPAEPAACAEGCDPRPAFSAIWASGNGGNDLAGFGMEPPSPGSRPLHFAGIHVLSADFLERLPSRAAFCLHRDAYVPFLLGGGAARVLPCARKVWDAGTHERYLALHTDLLVDPALAARLRGRPFPPERAPGCFVDAASEVPGDVRLVPPVLLEGVRVGAGSVLGPSLCAGPGARLGRDVRLARAVVCPGGSVPDGFAGDRLVVLP